MQIVCNPVFLAISDEPKHEQVSSRGCVGGAFVDGIDGFGLRMSAWLGSRRGESDFLIDDSVAERRVQESFSQAVELVQHVVHSTIATVDFGGACG